MDKFTVDLEKVLDEFEYNEGREEAVLPSVIRNHTYSHSSPRVVRPPAAGYRRPAFEPINLSDADFAAAPSSVCDQFISVTKQKSFKDSQFSCINENEGFISNPATFNYCNELNGQCATSENSKVVDNCGVIEGPLVISNNETKADDTPDLLDSNILKPSNGIDSDDTQIKITTLPDITSVRSFIPEPEKKEVQEVFDLIKPHSYPQVIEKEDLPPIVDIGTVFKDDLPVLNVPPITFDSVNIPESELVNYLDNLDVLDSELDDKVEEKFVVEELQVENRENVNAVEHKESHLEDIDSKNLVENVVDETETSSLEPVIGVSETVSSEVQSEVDIVESIPEIVAVSEVEREPETPSVSGPSVAEGVPSQFEPNSEPLPDDELVQNLQNIETERAEREVIDNRDNEEKAVQDQESEADFRAQGGPSEATETDSELKPPRPSSLPLPHPHLVTDSEESPTPSNSSNTSLSAVMSPEERTLGKMAPYWVPDTETEICMLCSVKFTVIKRRHHCRACGLVLCSKCCNLKAPLEYMEYAEARVCQPCFNIIYRGLDEGRYNRGRQPNPNNPMEYCSTVPPLQQASSHVPPPAVFVPTSVLKREGSRSKSETPKQVMFSDGIRPGGDLTELDGSNESSRLLPRRSTSRKMASGSHGGTSGTRRPLDPGTQSFIPSNGQKLPPAVELNHGSIIFLSEEVSFSEGETVKFALNHNLFVNVKKVKLDCCVNREVWSVSSEGLCLVGQDEVALLLECLPDESLPHLDVFHLINFLWKQGALGSTTSEMCFTPWFSNTLFGSTDQSGFLYIRPTLQCVTNLLLPAQPYLVAILVHRWETAWARLFPLRLVLRLGAEYRYYPCPLVSVRNRQPLYTDIGHTIMKILVDFRKFSYSLATVRGLLIHVEDRQTTILFPRNRYDQVTRALNNSNESVLAFGANLSLTADSHLVCIQGTKDENAYHTEAINIHSKPRKVTGASFVVFNGALKGSSGLSGKSCIVEDGLMVHLASDRMVALRSALRSMTDFSISCGPNDDETVLLHWTHDDTNFNIGVRSCIDGQPLDGVPSIRVHNGTDYPTHTRLIRWTEVFIIQCEDGGKAGSEPLDISRVSESLSRATCSALLPLIDSLATAGLTTLAVRATIHPDNVGYDAGSREEKLPSIYMKRLDDELVPVLHQAAITAADSPAVLELIFRVMNLP